MKYPLENTGYAAEIKEFRFCKRLSLGDISPAGEGWTSGAYHGGIAPFFVRKIICVGHTLWLPNTLTLFFGDHFFSIIMFVTLVVDNVVTLVVVTLVGDKIVTVVVDYQNSKT